MTLRELLPDADEGERLFMDGYRKRQAEGDVQMLRFLEAIAPYMFVGGPVDPYAHVVIERPN